VNITNKKFLNISDLSEYLGIAVNTIYSWIYQKKIPYTKVGRLVRFKGEEINKWIESRSLTMYSIEEKQDCQGGVLS
jgi:excisionase family DNA binding protein